ncbi:MAG: DUF885 domain-containing protein, partial [Myxococcota bacterium]
MFDVGYLKAIIGTAVVALASCSDSNRIPPAAPISPIEKPMFPPRQLPTAAEIETQLSDLSFDAFIDRSFAYLLARSPEAPLSLGVYDQYVTDGPWLDDLSGDFIDASNAIHRVMLARLKAFPRASLTAEQQTTYDVYEWYLDDLIRGHAFIDHDYQATQMLNAPHVNLILFFRDVHPLNTRVDAEGYIARLWQVERKLGQVQARVRRAAERGIVPPSSLLSRTIADIRALVTTSPRNTAFYIGLRSRLPAEATTADERIALLREAEGAVRQAVLPAYASLADTLAGLEGAPTLPGVGSHPAGLDHYAHALRHHTTTELSATQIHQIGLEQLQRIHAAMETRFVALNIPTTLTLRDKFARVATIGGTIEAVRVIESYEQIIAEAEQRVGAVFDLAPSSPVTVIGGNGGGFYVSPSFDGSRPGAFYAFSAAPQARFAMPTLAYHEAVPGHHFQIGISQDLQLPVARRLIRFTAYVEGWALYAERLAEELGWYEDDVPGDLGRLQAEAFRAARLVVDTGMHAFGWERQQAIDFMVEATGFDGPSARGQVDRYAAWPG